jgi:hypothetical protein
MVSTLLQTVCLHALVNRSVVQTIHICTFCTNSEEIRLGYELDNQGSITGRGNAGTFCPHRVQTGSGAHPDSCPMDIGGGGLFLGSKAAGA